MPARAATPAPKFGGILARLARDTRGNAMMIMAAMLVPLAAFSGSAIDMARLYTVKTRLQQACDAGVLAGRHSMTPANTIDTSSSGQAKTFFNNNFQSGWFQTKDVSFSPSVTSDFQVQGTAKATVPLTIMAMFDQQPRVITVTCQARYDVADTDIVFVLDTTGSMACTTADDPCSPGALTYTRDDKSIGYYDKEESGSKLSGVREAVMSFYDTLAGSVDASTRIRYAFVPYTSTVNVGSALAKLPGSLSSYLVTQWQYQTRHAIGDKLLQQGAGTVVSASSETLCQAFYSRLPALTTSRKPTDGSSMTNYTYTSNGTATANDPSWNGATKVCTVYKDTVIPIWRYEQWPLDTSSYIGGGAAVDPSKVAGNTSKWQGCIEETQSVPDSSFDPNNLPPDLDPNLIPKTVVNQWGFPQTGDPQTADTRWRPMWPDATYYRDNNFAGITRTGSYTSPYGDDDPSGFTYSTAPYSMVSFPKNTASGLYTCGMAATRLAVMTRAQVSAYVNDNDFRAIGGTYHDTGMIWGARFISPNGLFKNDTAAAPGRSAPNRYIVFMTDGQMNPSASIYGMYGMEYYDGRVTGKTGSNYSADLNNHNARFTAECKAARDLGITVFVVGFGQTLNSQLTSCASPNQAYYASDNASLTKAFQKMAQQVAMLRLSK